MSVVSGSWFAGLDWTVEDLNMHRSDSVSAGRSMTVDRRQSRFFEEEEADLRPEFSCDKSRKLL